MEPFGGVTAPTFGDLQGPESQPSGIDQAQTQALLEALQQGIIQPTHSVLSSEEEDALVTELEQVLSGYQDAMRERWETERIIDDCYNLVPQKAWQGEYPGAAELVSGKIMSAVDQAQARLNGNLLSVSPFVTVQGIDSVLPQEISTKLAPIVEQWADTYLKRELRIERELGTILYPTCKFGTAVVRAWWDPMNQDIDLKVLANEDVVVWPAWEMDWQRAEWAGHKTPMTVSQFRRFFGAIGTPPDLIEEIAGQEESEPEEARPTFADLKSSGIDASNVTGIKRYGLITIYELWGNLILPGDETMTQRAIRLYYHSGSRRILWSRNNDQRSQLHPYNPIRYKKPSMSAWGQGIGHELAMPVAVDSMHLNLEQDTLKSSCFGINLVTSGSTAEAIFDSPSPGMKVPTEDPKGDFVHASLADAGPLEMLAMARAANEQRAIDYSGLAAVLQGQGDPTAKSGIGTGGTMALIQEAGKKFGQIEKNIREDMVDLFLHIFEVAAQYGGAQPFMEFLAPEDGQMLSTFFQNVPPNRPLHKILRLAFAAPSAADNKEVRKNELMVLYSMMQQHAALMLEKFAMPFYQQANPAGLLDYLVQWAKAVQTMGERVIESHDVTGLRGKIPEIQLQATPAEMMANQLQQQNQQLQQQLQQIVGQLQQMHLVPPAGPAHAGSVTAGAGSGSPPPPAGGPS